MFYWIPKNQPLKISTPPEHVNGPPIPVNRSASTQNKTSTTVIRSVTNYFDYAGHWITPDGYDFLGIPMITLERMYELINKRKYYYELPDSLKKLHPFVMDASHIKSAIERAYTTSLIDARSQRNDHYSIGFDDDDSDESTDFLEGDMVPAYSDVVQEPIQMKYRHYKWFDRVVEDHDQMK
jgi:hypothetical protein